LWWWGEVDEATVGKNVFTCVYKGKIIKNISSKSTSNLHRSFQLKCKNEFHVMPWPPGVGWGNNKKIILAVTWGSF
jgi:hypothetical protein